ncbi:MAG: hypothetical protein M9938_06705 [Solirubrobacterales bacterium]|nr:hypothetical protein [Solirubrobacterales bacterium]
MSLRLTVITALLGSLIVILSQFVTAFTLQDPVGIDIAKLNLLDKHGPLVAILGAIAGLAVIFLITVEARAPEETGRVALISGIVAAGMGLAVILVFLLVDLPDVGDTGLYNTPGAGNLDATGVATAGLWLELTGGIVLLLAGAALCVAGSGRSDPD